MRRLLPTAIAVAVLVGTFAGVASARLAHDGSAGPTAAPFRAPAVLPREDAQHPGTYGFRPSGAIAAKLEGTAPAASAPAASTGASATVMVTATVLPVVTIVVDSNGDVTEVVTNTPERNPRGVLYVVRTGTSSGATTTLDAATWAEARAALAAAHEGTGTIWSS